jgi:hypothetical protein
LHRQIATGSTTAYALEFNRADNKLASALWTARGTVDYNLQFAVDTSVEVIDMYGRRSRQNTQGGKLSVAGGTAPTYVVADREITSITLSNRRFPADLARVQAATVAAPLDSAAAVTLEADSSLDTPQVFPLQLPIRLHDEFTVQQVVDETKGNCLEVAFKTLTKADANKYLTSYATLRLKTPAPVAGKPAALGLWVKGNSNWGRALFEIEDAGGIAAPETAPASP